MHHSLPHSFVLQDQLYDYLDLAQEVDFSQEIENLPVSNLSVLELYIDTGGHVFGALVWRLLGVRQICAAATRLIIDIAPWNWVILLPCFYILQTWVAHCVFLLETYRLYGTLCVPNYLS